MSPADLDELEQDVEAARLRVADDVARLRAPATIDAFKGDVLAQVHEVKSEWVQKATNAASCTAQHLWIDLKNRASANPAAAFAIGAGLAWRLARRPPISALLVTIGAASLVRTNPSSGPPPIVTRAADFGERLNEFAGTAKEKLRQYVEEAQEASGETISQASAKATEIADRTSEMMQRAISDTETRDAYLLGGAVLAVGAAGVIAFVRGSD